MIFIIEDDSESRESLRLLLDCAGVEARAFASAEAFLEDGKHGAADCLVIDIQLPGMSGLDLLEELRERGDAVSAIVVSARPTAANTARALAAGALVVLDKPFNPGEMVTRVQAEMAKKSPQSET